MLTLAAFAVNDWAPGGSGCMGPVGFPRAGAVVHLAITPGCLGLHSVAARRAPARFQALFPLGSVNAFTCLPVSFPFSGSAGVTACAGPADSRPAVGFRPWGLGFRCDYGFMVIMYNIREKCIKIRFAVRAPVYRNSHYAGRFWGL